jgi:general secretion pathway protein F
VTVPFRYRAATADGNVVEGVIQAPSRQVVVDGLRRQQLYPVSVDEATVASATKEGKRLSRGAAVALWTRTAATLIGAGMPIDRVLAFTAQHASHEGLADAVRQARRAVQSGSGLADALGRHPEYFDPLFVAMVSAGESSGALDVVFDQLSRQLEEAAELRGQVRSALLYPALMAIVACIGIGVLLGFVIPRFAVVLADLGGTLPWSARILLAASAVITKGWWVWVPLVAAGVYFARQALARPDLRRRWHAARLGWPYLGDLELKYSAARVTRTLGLLLKSSVPALPALKIARASASNLVVQESIDRAAGAIAEGSPLASSLSGALPPLALQMLAVGEESGKLDDMCLRIADTYDGEVRRALRTAVTLIEPALIITFGGLVGFVALAMLQAIYGVDLKTF